MKSKLARILRRWADLIAPCVKPIDEITIRTYVDPRDAAKAGELVKLAARQTLADYIVEDRCGNRRLRNNPSISIDARGTDPVLTEQRVREAIAATNYLKRRVPSAS